MKVLKFNNFSLIAILAFSVSLGGCGHLGTAMAVSDMARDLGLNPVDLFSGDSEEYHRDILTVEEGDIAGFRGLGWGDAPKSDMKLVRKVDETNNAVEVYERPGEKLRIGTTDLARVEYYFLDGKFIKADVVTVDNRKEGEKLREVVTTRYGDPMAPNKLGSNPLESDYSISKENTQFTELAGSQHWRAENGYVEMNCLSNKMKAIDGDQCVFSWASWGGMYGYNEARKVALKEASGDF